jgi:hypothetical protein
MIKTIVLTIGILLLIESMLFLLITKDVLRYLRKLKLKDCKKIGFIEFFIAIIIIVIGLMI